MADEELEEVEEEAEEEEFDDDEEGAPKPSRFRGKAKLFIIIGAVLFVLIGSGVGVWMSGLLDSLLGIEEKAAVPQDVFVEGTVFYKIEDMTLNMNTRGQASKFLKLGITLVLLNEADIPVVEALQPRIIDSIVGYLSELHPDEFAGSANIYKIREGLLMRVQAAVAPVRVTNVLFNSMLAQ